MIPWAARFLVTFLSVYNWQRCLSAYKYEQMLVPFTEPESISEHTDQLSLGKLNITQCVARYTTSEFRLQSPGFPAPYPPQLQCLYIVEAVSKNICRLQANFLNFDLGECTSGDHVIMAGQRLCGNLSGARTFRFSPPRSLILFRSGGVSGRRGFDLAIRQVPCPQLPAANRGCSREFSSLSVVLQSPGYPGPYPSNTRCHYVIRAPTTAKLQLSLCEVQFTLDDFNIDSSNDCTKDRLEIGDQEAVCGFLNGIRTYEFLGELHVDFYSDGTGNHGRFRIMADHRQCRTLNIPDEGQLLPIVLLSQRQPSVSPPRPQLPLFPPQPQPPMLPSQTHTPLLPPQKQAPLLLPKLPPPVLPPQPQLPVLTPALQPMTQTSLFHLPLCCSKVYSGRLFFIASPGFPFSNSNDNVDCIYDIRPYSPRACRLRILFKLFWVGQADSYAGCSGGFLEIDGHRYCDCIIGFTVISSFETVGTGRQKTLHYRQEGNTRNSGGFLLEIFQEDCTSLSPWNRHDINNVTVSWNGKQYFSRHDNAGIDRYNMAGVITQERHYYSIPYTHKKAVDETDRPRKKYWNELRNKEGENGYVDSKTIDRSVDERSEVKRDGLKYSHCNNSVDESNASFTGNSKNKTCQLNPDSSNGRNMAIQTKHGVDTINKKHNVDNTRDEPGINSIQNGRGVHNSHDHNYTIHNSNKQTEIFKSVHKCSSCVDNKGSVTDFSDDINIPGYQNQNCDIVRSKAKQTSGRGKDKFNSNTKYNYNARLPVGNANVSPVHLWDFDVISFLNDMAANGDCQSCGQNCTVTARQRDNCTGLQRDQTTSLDSRLIRFKTPAKRNVVLSESQTEGFWSIRESACRAWGFAQWLLQLKRYMWMLFPQLLCPIDYPSQSPPCQVLNEARGWIQSPRYPQAYPNNVKLCYRFKRLTGYCHIQMFMLDFSLEASEHCVKDYILLGGRWRYCGETLMSTGTVLDMSVAPHMDLLLVSDSQYSGRGFRALYQHIPCDRRQDKPPADCEQVTDREYFTLSSSGSMGYRSCAYRILQHNNNVCGLRLNFTDFSLPCGAEYLQINGLAYCGNLPGRSIEVAFFKTEVRIVYNRMDLSGKGHFIIQGKQLKNCDFGLCEYEETKCMNEGYCTASTFIKIKTRSFDFRCHLFKYDCYEESRKCMCMWCDVSCFCTAEVPLAATASNSTTQCDFHLSEVRGFVVSTEIYLSSPSPEACAYVFHAHQGMCSVRVVFGDFNVPSTANCRLSFMEIHRQKFCNNQLEYRTTVMDFDGMTLRVPFHTEGSPGNYYWNFTYTQIPCSE